MLNAYVSAGVLGAVGVLFVVLVVREVVLWGINWCQSRSEYDRLTQR